MYASRLSFDIFIVVDRIKSSCLSSGGVHTAAKQRVGGVRLLHGSDVTRRGRHVPSAFRPRTADDHFRCTAAPVCGHRLPCVVGSCRVVDRSKAVERHRRSVELAAGDRRVTAAAAFATQSRVEDEVAGELDRLAEVELVSE